MACNNSNGRTYVNTCIPVPGATADSAAYVVDLTHFNCGNRKICANGAYPLTAKLDYRAYGAPQPLGNGAYQLDIIITGTLTYVPFRCGQPNDCCPCPVTENIWTTVSVPVTSATTPTITAGDAVASPTNLSDCRNITNAVSIVGSFLLEAAAGAKK